MAEVLCQPAAAQPSADATAAQAGSPDSGAAPPAIRVLVLDAGESWGDFRARWEAFVREDDFACSWGRYPLDLLEAEGGALPKARRDMRPVAGGHLGARTGSVEDCTTRLGVAAAEPFALGRGGTRLAALTAIVDKMMSL